VSKAQRLSKEDGVRVTTAFNRLLALPGARVTDVAFAPDGVIVRVALRRRRLACSVCGQVYRGAHDAALRRWRHMDVGGQRCFVEYRLRRVACRDCGVRVEAVPWARTGARHTRDFEDLVAFLAQQMAKTAICALVRIGWDTIGSIVARVVADHLDQARLAGLVAVGVDEISYRRGQRYLTVVGDHATSTIVWCAPGRNAQTLQAFFDELGQRKRSIRAVSIDMNGGYEKAIRAALPDAEVAFDPFHVIRLAGDAVDAVRRAEWNAAGKSKSPAGRWVKHARWSLLKAPERQSAQQLARLGEVQHTNRRLYRAFLLYHELRLLPARRPRPGTRPPEGVAGVGVTLATEALRPARPHPARPPRRHPRRHPPRTLQQPPRGPQQQDPADLTPLLRLPRAPPTDRPHLPLLRRHPPPTAAQVTHSNDRSARYTRVQFRFPLSPVITNA
jgi:transposase